MAEGRSSMTVREAIKELLKTSDLDAEVFLSFNGSDPLPISEITSNEGEPEIVQIVHRT